MITHPENDKGGMIKTWLEMGFLRNGLHLIALLFAALMPFASRPDYSDNWDLFFGGILPATAPIIVIVIGLDIMMSSIWKSDATPERVAQLNQVITAHLIVGGILLAAWLIVFLPVLT
jgi:hypothetical protein